MQKKNRPPLHTRLLQHSEWIFIVPALALLALFALPIFSLVWRAGVEGFLTYATQPSALTALRLSLWTSTLSMFIAIAMGTPLAFLLARRKFTGKVWLELLVDLPIVLPPSVAGVALLIAFGRQGLFGGWLSSLGITLPFSTAAVILAQTFVSAPLFVRSVRVGFAAVDVQLREAAYVEGANEWQLFRHVMLPVTGRAILSGSILAWTRALGEFGATILFAGNMEGVTQTMPLAIYLGFERSLGVAIALSVVLVFTSVILLLVARQLEDHTEKEQVF